jgi:hypothetical protein
MSTKTPTAAERLAALRHDVINKRNAAQAVEELATRNGASTGIPGAIQQIAWALVALSCRWAETNMWLEEMMWQRPWRSRKE